jgi:acyl-CoA reductase-like NAD-dependent aldehyde dehydrogenase
MATQRVIVDEKVADDFVGRFRTKALTLETGNPATSNAPLAAVFDAGTVARCRRMVDDAVGKGAALVCGGEGEGVFFNPTILDHVKPGMEAYTEEAFGPVVSVIRAKDDDHAVELANDTEYGLSAAVYGRDINRALGVAQRIESGICHVNGPTVQDEAQIPFGGVKSSGYGRFGGRAGIEAFTETRWITLETHKRHFPI